MNNLGIQLPVGSSFPIVNPSGDWTPYQPSAENQFSNNADTMACVSYSACHCLETQIKYLTGQSVDLSERFLAKVSGTTHQGNWVTNVANAINQFGLVKQEDWPVPPNFTWDEYYADIPQSVLDKAKMFLDNWSVQADFVDILDIPQAIKQAPIQIIITQQNPIHSVELLNTVSYFDSYPPYNKPLETIHTAYKIVLTPKNMFKLVQVSGSPEVWIVKDGKKTHVYNPAALLSVSDFSQIIPISQADLDALPNTQVELAGLTK